MTRSLALEVARDGILVNAIGAGAVLTENWANNMLPSVRKQRPELASGSDEALAKLLGQEMTPVGRFGRPDKIAALTASLPLMETASSPATRSRRPAARTASCESKTATAGGTMSDKVSVIASFFPKAGKESDVEQILRGMIGPTRAEPGCERYELYGGTGSPPSFHLFEIYENQAALEAHRNTPHYKSYRARIADLLSEPIKVQVLRALNAEEHAQRPT